MNVRTAYHIKEKDCMWRPMTTQNNYLRNSETYKILPQAFLENLNVQGFKLIKKA